MDSGTGNEGETDLMAVIREMFEGSGLELKFDSEPSERDVVDKSPKEGFIGLGRQKRKRRTKEQIEILRCGLYWLLHDEHPMTVRQVFYRLVSEGCIDKTEADYKNVVVRLLSEMRVNKDIPFQWIADNTRWQRKPRTYSSLEQAVRRAAEEFRRSIWDNQDVYVEIWLEKDALAGVVYEETEPWDVPLMVTRGYPSLSYLFEAAEYLESLEKPAYLYYFGDYDPSGVDISRNVEERLREFAPDAEIHFERLAVEPWQIESWNLPTRPTKKSDSRAKSFKGESVEVDAITPRQLRDMVSDCIQHNIDARALHVIQVKEESERQWLKMWPARLADEMGDTARGM